MSPRWCPIFGPASVTDGGPTINNKHVSRLELLGKVNIEPIKHCKTALFQSWLIVCDTGSTLGHYWIHVLWLVWWQWAVLVICQAILSYWSPRWCHTVGVNRQNGQTVHVSLWCPNTRWRPSQSVPNKQDTLNHRDMKPSCWSGASLHNQKCHKGWTSNCTQLHRIITHAIKLFCQCGISSCCRH